MLPSSMNDLLLNQPFSRDCLVCFRYLLTPGAMHITYKCRASDYEGNLPQLGKRHNVIS
jgi:hypothetical protein